MTKPLTGRVPPEAIKRRDLPRLASEALRRFEALQDLTGASSDAMDNLGLFGAVPASVLTPSLPTKRVVGQVVTVRNVARRDSPTEAAAARISRMGEQEAYNQAEPGDVVVIEGLADVSNMGGMSASLAHRAGCAAVVIDGGFRDPDASRGLGLPVWARGVTPITGKWRLETVEINGPVHIAGVAVDAGDLALADEAGVVFIPFAQALAVLAEAERIDQGDRRQGQDIAAGVDLQTLAGTKYK